MGSRSLSYHARGNVTALGSLGFTYDASNQPVAVNGTATGSYAYDGHLRRAKQIVGGVTRYSVYDVSGGLVSIDQAGAGPTEYIRASGMVLARVAGTGSTGSVVWRESEQPFGEDWITAPANDNQAGYTGHVEDAATGLVYMQARYYDPVIGPFLANDPVGFSPNRPDMFNRYAYAGNDPVNNWDPDGRFFGLIGKGIKLAIKGGDVGATVAGAVTDAKAVFASPGSSTVGARALAAASLASEIVSPVSGRDAKAGLDAAGDAIDGAAKLLKTCCFVAGTLVDTEQGLRPIEDIQLGDRVWSRDAETGETALKEVTDLIRRHERVIWELALLGAGGEVERFETTDDHPWWIAGQGWKTTEELLPGMAVVTRDGRGMIVTSVEETERTDATYNLTVADFETYFVGAQRVLVHNCDQRKSQTGRGRPALKDDPYSPESVSRRQSETRREMGTGNLDPESPIPDQGPGENLKSSHSAKPNEGHDTGERNVNRHEEHSVKPKGPKGPRGN